MTLIVTKLIDIWGNPIFMNYQPSDSEHDSGNSMNTPNSPDSEQKPGKHSDPSQPVDPVQPSVMVRCSYCGGTFDKNQSKHMPFCSKRCQEIDLGMWLNESYGFPHEGESALNDYGDPSDDED